MPRKKRRLTVSGDAPTKRNPVARALGNPLFKARKIENKKYKALNRRKAKHNAKLYGDYHFGGINLLYPTAHTAI
jgi:stalled ribosome alternative rescue factor ArfA